LAALVFEKEAFVIFVSFVSRVLRVYWAIALYAGACFMHFMHAKKHTLHIFGPMSRPDTSNIAK
jgi:hypothetical protein